MNNQKNLAPKERKKLILRTVAWCVFAISIVLFIIGANLNIKGADNCDPYFIAMGGLWIVAFFCHFAGNT